MWCVLWSNSVTREAHISNVRHHPWCRHRRGLFFVVAAVHEVIEAGVTHVYMQASKPNPPIRQHPLSHARLFVPCVFVLCCCMKFCSSFCDAGGVFGVCGAMASDWNREDLFNLAPGDIHKLKNSIGTTLRNPLLGMLPGQGHGSLFQRRGGIDSGEIAELCQGDAGDDV